MSEPVSVPDRELAQRIVNHLERLLLEDPKAVRYLMGYKVAASGILMESGAAVVSNDGEVGLLGILNGLVGLKSDGTPLIRGVHVNHQLDHFKLAE